jgi:peptide/nickel transport system substrate-binding protein
MFVALLALALALAGCGSTPGGGQVAPTSGAEPAGSPAPAASGGTLRVGRTAAPDSLNPGATYLVEGGEVQNLVYDALIGTDLRLQPVPQLADEWSVAEDGKTWTFKLNPGAKWHDGQPATAADVKFTYEMIMGFESFGLLKDYTSLIASVEAPDPQTAVITFEEPVANTTERFAGLYILPQHIWQEFAADETAATEFTNESLIGSGPFKLAEYKQAEFTRLSAVKDHYRTPPQIDEVIFRVFGNFDAMIQALRTGEIDTTTITSNTVVRSLQSEANIKVEIGNQLGLSDIIFNITDPANCPPEVGKCTGHPALRDVQVRQALAHATDKQQLIDVVLLGLGTPGLGLVMPGHGDAFASELEDYAFDVEKAKQILEAAGYADSDGDGVREMPGDPSKPLRFRYSFPSDQSTDGTRVFEVLRDMWLQAGVAIDLTPLEADALTAVCCPAFDFDVINWGWSGSPDPSGLLYIATTEQIPTGVSETGYANPEYDELFAQQQVTVDPAARQAILKQMQAIMLRDVPYIIPYYRQNVQAYRSDRFAGWVIDPEGVLALESRLSLVAITPVQP